MRCSSMMLPSCGDQLGLERRQDVEVATGEPREEAVADQSMAEMRRQQAERAREAVEAR